LYDFITQALNIPLGSATVSGTLSGSTLTVQAAAPTTLPASVPSWLPSPAYVSTQLVIDESAGGATLTASTGTASGLAATLSVAIANVSATDLSGDVTGSLTLDGVPFVGGSTAALAFTLGYASSALTASLSGSLTSPAAFAGGVVTIPAGSPGTSTLTLATGSGITLNSAVDLTEGGQTTEVAVTGTLTSLSNWSLAVSNASGASWQPVAGLTVTPDFTGSVSDTGGTVGFDLKAGGTSASPITWISPDGSSSLSVGGLELSNQAPATGAADCAASQVKDGDVWIGANGTFTYNPASVAIAASGCFDVTGKNATITTNATGNLTSAFGSALPFTVTQAGLTAHIGGSYSLTGTAAVTITGGGVSGAPQFNVGLRLASGGITAGAGGSSLSSLGLSGGGFSGSGALYLSTATVPGFDPSAFGIAGQQPFTLPAGLSVSASYTLPSDIEGKLQMLLPSLGNRTIPGLTGGTSIQALASLSGSGFMVDLGIGLGAATSGLTVYTSSKSSLYLNALDIKLALGAENQLTLSGTGYLVVQGLAPSNTSTCPAGQTCSPGLSITLSGSFNVTSLTLALGFNVGTWNNAFGIGQLNVQDFGGNLGLTLESGLPTPSLDLYADNIMLPPSWQSAIGMVNGTSIWFNANLSLTQPVLALTLNNPYGPVLKPLSIDPNASAAVVNSFVVNSASFVLAPAGGTTNAGDVIQPGVGVVFDATVAGVTAHVDAAVNLAAPSVTANASISPVTIGTVQTSSTMFHLNLSPTNVSLGISGGLSYGGNSFQAGIQLTVGSSLAGAGVTLAITGGLPSYFEGGASLSGTISGSGSGASISATGSGWLYAAGNFLGPVSFSFSLPGSLTWADYNNTITQVAQFFVSAGLPFTQIVTDMQQFGYDTYDTINALGDIGQWGPGVISALASAFGFSTTYYDIWTYTSSGQFLVLDVTGGSQQPNAGVETWTWNNGYNQDWAFVPSPYSGWYEIVSRGSGQCLSVGGNNDTAGNQLVQWPCSGAYNQLWYLGGISLANNYYIESALDGEYADVQGAYPWAGGVVDQWYYNGGQNQKFWLTNSSN
jgi:hypothetical protein